MTEILTAAQMRGIEAAAIASGEVTGLELMERAGRGVVEAVFEEWPELQAGSFRAVVLCGPGNNGGDGFVVARLLKDWGWAVEVFLYGDAAKLPRDARVNYERWLAMGEVALLPRTRGVTFEQPDLVVDALFGTGLTRPIRDLGPVFLDLSEETARAEYFHFPNNRVTAIDLPSGLCSDSGSILEPESATEESRSWQPTGLRSQLTVTFHRLKRGHVLGHGPRFCGKVVVKDIGLPDDPGMSDVSHTHLITAPGMHLLKKSSGHKFSHGHALIATGDQGRAGAARLAARGALRIGAGLVTVASPPGAMAENAARLDAVMLRAVADGDAFGRVLQDERINALCLGPGMGTGAREAELVAVALAGGRPEVREITHPTAAGRLVVLDADALRLVARDPALFALLHGGCVLTPHGGEFARLFPDIAERPAAPATRGPAYSKVDACRDAAARAGCVVLFKGADTVIADPSGRCAIHAAVYDRAAPWLATAGSGDVLAGFITGLLARGFAPFDAACTGAWLHVECARSFGPGLIAEDLPEELPKVFRALGV